jgi:serine/threonine-protein kinase
MIGTVVGNYKIVEKIGEGGMGSVFRGIDIMLEREVAIKMLRPELGSQPNVVERFRTEAVTLAKLSHPNIATLHSFFRQRDDFFMVMEFVRGETLDHLIRNRGAMTLDHALPLFCQSLEGIGLCSSNGNYSPRHQARQYDAHARRLDQGDGFWNSACARKQ